jgi:cytochrome c oxidase subunit IV
MDPLSYQMTRNAASFVLAILAASAIQFLGQETNFVHNTSPLAFVVGSGAVTAVAGVVIGWLVGLGKGKVRRMSLLGGSLLLGYMGIAGFMLYSGYYFWFVVPLVLVLQGLIARLVMEASWRSILLVLGITVTYLLAGVYVSMNREDFGVNDEHYFFFLIFLHPQLSVLLSRAWGS